MRTRGGAARARERARLASSRWPHAERWPYRPTAPRRGGVRLHARRAASRQRARCERQHERQQGRGRVRGRGRAAQCEAARRPPAATTSPRASRASYAPCCCADAPTHAALPRHPTNMARLCGGPRGPRLRKSRWSSCHPWRRYDASSRCANAPAHAAVSRHPADLARLCRAPRRPRLWQPQPRRPNRNGGYCVTQHTRRRPLTAANSYVRARVSVRVSRQAVRTMRCTSWLLRTVCFREQFSLKHKQAVHPGLGGYICIYILIATCFSFCAL